MTTEEYQKANARYLHNKIWVRIGADMPGRQKYEPSLIITTSPRHRYPAASAAGLFILKIEKKFQNMFIKYNLLVSILMV
ncbi:MAG TPA: hypothetical protein DEB31_01535 [Clostridiales bacterium]|nr:hypothetical protein [Clostridiales bacterium]